MCLTTRSFILERPERLQGGISEVSWPTPLFSALCGVVGDRLSRAISRSAEQNSLHGEPVTERLYYTFHILRAL
jgi:hypothetical protein